jgi:hypothetical protein
MDWFFRLPLLLLFPLIVGGFVAATLAGMLLLAPWRTRVLARFPKSNEQSAYFGTQIWLVYSLILSLVAVGAWSEYQAANEKVSREVSTLEVLQRRASLYPEPMRTRMDALLRQYAAKVADEEWPEQKEGKHPSAAKHLYASFATLLGDFEPATLPQQMVHAETLREATAATEARRARIHATHGALPPVVWMVMLLGAAMALGGATFFVHVDDGKMHAALVAIMAAFVGLVVFVTVALDHPFQGTVTPSESGFRYVAERPFGGQ